MIRTCHATFAKSMLAATLACFTVSGCFAAPKPESTLPQWKTECVGRYQISVPGEVEFALAIPEAFTNPNVLSPYRFSDGVIAAYTGGFPVMVGYPATRQDFETLTKNEGVQLNQARQELLKQAEKERIDFLRQKALDSASSIALYPLNIEDAFAWESGAVTGYLYRAGRIYMLKEAERDISVNKKRFDTTLKNFRPRAPYELPAEPGVCIPYGFIADDGSGSRHIGVTMRLKDHPDVEIFFEDSTNPDTSDVSAKEQIELFWQYRYRGYAKLVKVDFPGYRTVELDGREGKASPVEIIRDKDQKNYWNTYRGGEHKEHPDDKIDYGYLAVVKGDPGATEDTPNLTLYVIRTAGRAKNTPVTEEQLKDMARQIAASIKRRPSSEPQSASGN